MKAGNAEREKRPVLTALEWIFLLSPFLLGLFFAWTGAPVVFLLALLLFLLLRRNLLRLSSSPLFLAATSLVLFQLGGIFWGTDRGVALLGAVQFLPLPLFILLLEQFTSAERGVLLHRVPYAASVMVILSLLLSRIGSLSDWFLVAGRQAGFFQYPNTYAVYLLSAVVLVLFGGPLRGGPLPWLGILIIGIFLSGSRTVFVLLFAVLIIYLFREKQPKIRNGVLGLIAVLALFGIILAFLPGGMGLFARYLTISASSSELLGRLLYARDAIPVILKHPLGLGYTGYRWLQGSFQTGVYSVQHVHNELLQLLLDVGWVPAGLLLWTLWRSFRSREGGFGRKLLLSVLLLHCLLDFDTQFVSVAMLLFLVTETEPPAVHPVRHRFVAAALLTGSSLLSIWIGTASLALYLQNPGIAAKIYPAYTQAMVELLPEASGQEADRLADRILALNDAVAAAHDEKARSAFFAGQLDETVSQKQKAISLSRYSLTEYLDYFDLLRSSYERCMQTGDSPGEKQCLQLMRKIPQMLDEVKAQTSPLGWQIHDRPSLELPADRLSWLAAHRTVQG